MAGYDVSPVNGSGVPNTTSLAQTRIFSGEVLSAFIATNIMEKFVHKKVLSSGLSMRFPVVSVGKHTDVKTHVAGEEIDINTGEAGERIITIRELEYDSRFIDNKQAKVLDFDITSPFTKALGQSLAQKLDRVLTGLLRTAVTTVGVAGQGDGSWIYDSDITNASLTAEQRGNAHIAMIHKTNVKLDENNVSPEGRVYITTPAYWYDISQGTKVRSKDFTTKNGGIDVFSTEVIWIGNTMVVKSNNLALTDGFVGYAFTKEAIGLVTFISVITENTYLPTRFGNLITSRYNYGAGILNPSCVVGVRNVNTAL